MHDLITVDIYLVGVAGCGKVGGLVSRSEGKMSEVAGVLIGKFLFKT